MSENQNSKIAVVTGATGGMGVEIVANLVADHHVCTHSAATKKS